MKKVLEFLLLVYLPIALASDNGKYYVCDTAILASDNQCIFTLTGDQPTDWVAAQQHDINRSVGDDFFRGVQSYDGVSMLSVSPKPWVNGDTLAPSADAVTGDVWSYSLVFELMAPLRDMMMYNPTPLIQDENLWKLYTRALTDCNSKTEDYNRGNGSPFSTAQVYEYLKDPNGQDIHHFILQYLEEGSIDLVCLSTNLNMTHCDVMRETAGATMDVDRCNCWFDAYKALYGECPEFDTFYTTCSGTTATQDCVNATAALH